MKTFIRDYIGWLKENWPPFAILGFVLISSALISSLLITGIESSNKEMSDRAIIWRQEAYDEGRRAQQLGLPSTANPYQNGYGSIWLDGYMDSLEKK